jgi:hypothetical protein
MKLLFSYLEHLNSLRLGHAKPLMRSWVGLFYFFHITSFYPLVSYLLIPLCLTLHNFLLLLPIFVSISR